MMKVLLFCPPFLLSGYAGGGTGQGRSFGAIVYLLAPA